MLNLNQSINW